MSKFFKQKTFGFWLAFVAAAVFLISDIIFLATDIGDRTFSFVTFIFILLGIAAQIAYAFIDHKLADPLPLLSCVFYGVAIGQHWKLGLGTLSDVWNGVVFVGGNAVAALTFGIIFTVCTVAAVAACFMKQKKN